MRTNAFGKVTLTLLAMSFLACVIVASLSAPLVSGVQAQDAGRRCSAQSLKGSYGYLNTGTFAGTPLASVGAMAFDGVGAISGNDTNSFGGSVSSNPFGGSYTVNADCSGTLNVSFGFFTVNNKFVIVDSGKEILMIETNPGAVATGVFKRQ